MHLILQSYGSKLRVKDGLFEIVYFDQKQQIQKEQFAPQQVKSISMELQSSISSNAALLAVEHQVDLLILDKFGFPVGRFCSTRPNSTATIQKMQALLSNRKDRFNFVKTWLSLKFERQQDFIQSLYKDKKYKREKVQLGKCIWCRRIWGTGKE